MSEKSLFKKIIKSSAVIFIGNTLGVGAIFFARLLAARHLAPESYGLLVLGIAVLNILTIVSLLGFRPGLSQMLPRTDDPVPLIRTGMVVSMSVAVCLAVTAYLTAGSFVSALDELGLQPVFRIFVIAVPFYVFVQLSAGIFRGHEDSLGRVLSRNFLTQGLILATVATTIFFQLGVVELSLGWLIALVAGAAGSGLLLLNRIPDISVSGLAARTPFDHPKTAKNLVYFSLPLMISGVTARILNQADNLLLGYYLTSDTVGLYDAAFLLGMSLQLLSGGFRFLTLPVLSDLHASSDFDRMDRIYKLTTKWMVFLAFPVYVTVILNPSELITVFFGAAYGKAGALVLIFVMSGFFIDILLGLNGSALIAVGDTKVVMVSNVVALCLNIVLNVVLIPEFGITGAAFASFASMLTLNVVRTVYLYSTLNIQPFYRQFGILLVSIVLIAAANEMVTAVTENIFALSAVVALVHFTGVAVFGGIEAEERDLLESSSQRIKNVFK